MLRIVGAVLLGLSVWACSERVEINAPYEDIWVIYGILDWNQDTQYVRISKAFQTEQSAFEFARTYFPQLDSLIVRVEGNGKTYLAQQIDSVAKDISDGDFGPYATVFRIITQAENRLKEGEVYQLHIRSASNDQLHLKAQTRIPVAPQIIFPALTRVREKFCLNEIPIEDSVRVIFRKNKESLQTTASHFEIRIKLNFQENGQDKTIAFGPTRLFNESISCNGSGNNNLCYLFRDGIISRSLQAQLASAQSNRYTPFPACGDAPANLSRAVEIQLTAIDTFLARYILANDPRFTNFNTIRKEYTNVSGSAKAVGVFGSIAYDNQPVGLTACGEYQLGLNGVVNPGNCN